MKQRTFSADRKALVNGATTIAEITASFLEEIEAANADLNIFVTVDPAILESASQLDHRLGQGENLPLAGMIVSVKDVFAQEGISLTCASRMLTGFESLYTATPIQRLIDQGALVIGRTNCDEFAMGSSNENSIYGPVRNPVDRTRVPGGSSGGAAAAVAAGMCHVSIGSDTGGSVRQPAAFCGVYGLKPTYGRVSRSGLVAFASSLDCVGVLANCPDDAAHALSAMNGFDLLDATSAEEPPMAIADIEKCDLKDVRVGIPTEILAMELPASIRKALLGSQQSLMRQGIEFDEVSLPNSELGVAAYYIVATAEASSNLGRYDGVRYGFQSSKVDDDAYQGTEAFYVNNRSEGFGDEVKRRLMLGTYVLSAGYYDEYYGRAQAARSLIKKDFADAFDRVDAILLPVTPTVAYPIGSKRENVIETYLEDVFTVTANLAGIPGMAIPMGTDPAGLPVGVQLLGNNFSESLLLALAGLLAGTENKN